MLERPDVQEVIVGAVTDPTFGKVVAFGLGGVLVEVLKDVTFRLAPLDADEARVDGRRHHGGRDAAAACAVPSRSTRTRWPAVIQRLSDLVTDFPEIAEVDLNPVLAAPDGATAVDVRILRGRRGAPASRSSGSPRRRSSRR